jgi:hypothetical protein
VFLDFREVQDDQWHAYADLAAYLNGRGVPNLDEAMREIFLQPIHSVFKELVNPGMFRWLIDARVTEPDAEVNAALLDEVEQKAVRLLREVKQFTAGAGDEAAIALEMRHKLKTMLQLPLAEGRFSLSGLQRHAAAGEEAPAGQDGDLSTWGTLLSWLIVHPLGKIVDESDFEQRSRSWIDEWLLGKIVAGTLRDLGLDDPSAWQVVARVKLFISHQRRLIAQAPEKKRTYPILESLLKDGEVQRFLQVNRYQGILWFNKETFERLLWWLWALAVVELSADLLRPAGEVSQAIAACTEVVEKLRRAEEKSGYQVEKLLELARG